MKYKNITYFTLSILLSSILLFSCTSYPLIPEMEEMGKVKGNRHREVVEPISEGKDYLIGPGDRLKITVWDVEGLTQEVVVNGDESFSYPLLGRIKAAGLPVFQVEKKIRGSLIAGEFVVDPQVTVSVTYKARCFFIQGEVKNPGRYELEKGTTVLKAISLAQGETPRANLGKIKILRETVAVTHRSLPEPKPTKSYVLTDNTNLREESTTKSKVVQLMKEGEQFVILDQYVQDDLNSWYFIKTESGPTGWFCGIYKGKTRFIEKETLSEPKSTKYETRETPSGVRVKISVELNDEVKPQDVILVPRRFF